MAGSEIEPANSTSGEEEEASTEISESESEPDKTSTPPPSSKKTHLVPNSSSDSESDPEKPDPSIKPVSFNPMATDTNPAKKPRSKSTGKRDPAEKDGGDMKRAKKIAGAAAPDSGGEKKQLFQRLWSEDNEIELIQGMIDYVAQKGKDPLADMNEFYDFVNESLHIDVNNRQVLTKGRRLKKKFENNFAKVEKSGKVRSFSNPHEKKMYDLSKNLWGSGSNNNVVIKNSSSKKGVKVNVTPKSSNKSHKTVKTVGFGNGNRVNANGFDPLSDDVVMSKGLEKFSGSKRVEIEENWKGLKVQELELFVKKVELLKEQAEVVLNAITKSGGANC